ncbi:MAG: glutamate synthase large subunit, partial [Gammaproteobacteria bacterium]|nr:glutamate synthase large subunit [Gammaproteobacteria bacterium]
MANGHAAGLYSPAFERDSCGFGLIASMDDLPSRHVVISAMTALQRLTHRGAVDADGKTGDGCGLLLKFPEAFLRRVAAEEKIDVGTTFAVGQIFLDQDPRRADYERLCVEEEIQRVGLETAGWREVPVDPDACGKRALESLPRIEQVFVRAPNGSDKEKLERRLFLARRRSELVLGSEESDFYVCSLSCQTLSYKGMVMPAHLPEFYPDLANVNLTSSVCVFHQRFSTNTLPRWSLAQPFRLLAHNGEINTIQGNRNWAHARRNTFYSELLPELSQLTPIVSSDGSDSQSLDNMLEFLQAGGMDVVQAIRLLIPPAWQTVDAMDSDLRAFYEFFAAHMEPWDGPAGIVLTNGRYAICLLDRNGLRPARFLVTSDRLLVVASETGIYNCPDKEIVMKGKLGPGEMLALDLHKKRLLRNQEINDELKTRAPYKKWLKQGVRYLDSELVDKQVTATPFEPQKLATYEKMFDLSFEERTEVIKVLAEAEAEAIGSMGDDTPVAVLSTHVRSLFDYFRQQFAQVTNPPIDPLREKIVMSLQTEIGKEFNVFQPEASHARQIVLSSPVLSQRKFEQILSSESASWKNTKISLNLDASLTLPEALDHICHEAAQAVRDGTVLLVLSDRDITESSLPVHALLATGAVHHHLTEAGIRSDCNIVVETGTARDPHHFACLIGYGATAVYPYMAYQCIADMIRSGEIRSDYTRAQLGRSYRRGIRKGLMKIISKMGISTIASYRAAALFEIVGLADEVVDRCFPGTVSRIQGANFLDLEDDRKVLAARAWNPHTGPGPGGLLKYVHGGESHMYSAEVIASLQAAVRTNDQAEYDKFRDLVNQRPVATIRDMLGLRTATRPIPISEVEPASEILKRIDCAGMSLGALSPEAHEALAIAMNRLGGRSNSGEGGEDRSRHGNERMSKIKQVASGRFGVTPEYLVNAEVIQIKMAQGAKPGEGGQLPGHKVNKMIAELRYASPGVGLISPPPHHDIYSIEDLAQLIFDLKQVNPTALVSVKLVAEPGVGTIAAGVCKAYADLITISGHDGGTGASPLTSVKYAGSPWEIGLAEARQVLRSNGLRHKVQLQTDGGLKTGLDIVKAALLGADSFGFGTAPLVALGCKYLRICHLNNCATGVATQNDVLRKHHFVGLPEMVERYFRFVVEEVRQIMAELGVRKMDELVGAVELL